MKNWWADVRIWGTMIFSTGALLTGFGQLGPSPAWACDCTIPPCSASGYPCNTCNQCVYAGQCYSENSQIEFGCPEHCCSIYCNMPDCSHTCTWWSDCM
jgi:hypothetical protein